MAVTHLEEELFAKVTPLEESDIPAGTQLVHPALDPEADKRYRINLAPKPGVTQEDIVYWWMYVYKPGTSQKIEQDVFSKWCNAHYEKFQFARPSGYTPRTGQSAIQYTPYRDVPTETQVREINSWLAHVTPIVRDDENHDVQDRARFGDKQLDSLTSFKVIGIMSRDLSASGVVQLIIDGDGECYYAKTRWGSTESKKLGTLPDAVAYLQKKDWYQIHTDKHLNVSESEDEDDD